MKKKGLHFLACLAVLVGLAQLAGSISQGGAKVEYRPVANWLHLPDGFQFGSITAVAVDNNDNLLIFHRAKRPIVVFDKTGKFLRSWGDDQVKTAHGLRLDPEGNVWTTDLGTHQVIKYDPMGKVLLTLGQKNQAGATQDTFNKPADIAFTPGGDFYVADGYGNSRVVKFSKEGKYLLEWGKKGKAPGEFNLPHAIFLDAQGRVHVGDRENNRVQVFTAEGKFLEQWTETGAPYGLFLQKEKKVLVADGRGNAVRILDVKGNVQERFGMKGMDPGQFNLPHGICADSQGAI
jgi:DNA-binding beta-propeller fold protein YncE